VEVGLHLLVLGLFEELIFERLVYAVVLEGGASCGACSVFALVDARLVEGGTSAVALELERRCLGTCPCTCGTCPRVACRPTLGGSCEGAVPLQCWAGSWGVPMPICRVDVEKPRDVVLDAVVSWISGRGFALLLRSLRNSRNDVNGFLSKSAFLVGCARPR